MIYYLIAHLHAQNKAFFLEKCNITTPFTRVFNYLVWRKELDRNGILRKVSWCLRKKYGRIIKDVVTSKIETCLRLPLCRF